MPLPHFRAGLGTVLTLALLCPAALAVSAPKPDPSDRERDRASMGSSRDPATRAPVRVTPARSHGPLGIDVSNWQKTVDWKGLRSQGKRFAYIKATEGTSYRSPRFSSQYNGSYAAGYIRGAYHYANPAGKSGRRQANYFVDHGGGWSRDNQTLPGMLDIEYGRTKMCYGRSKARMVRWITSFLKQYKKRTGRHAVIYTTRGWWEACTGNSTKFAKTNPLFIARWQSSPGTLPGGWKRWAFWQYTDRPIDQDMFNGSLTELRALANGT
jgi:GH25 family lysozyme M1 (1,4-beta-N-acetylmuramidase)